MCQATFVGTGSYTFPGTDNYSVEYVANIAETDEVPADDIQIIASPYALDPAIYARDNGNFDKFAAFFFTSPGR